MILENLKNKQIILASKSPRRQELMHGIGLNFTVHVKEDIDEDFDLKMPSAQVATFLALKKANSYLNEIKENVILITADTIVCTEDEILNKPSDRQDAIRMLQHLSGKQHKVITGVCIKSTDREITFSSESIVYFKVLELPEIEYYVDQYNPYDKAGAYGIQEWIGYIGITRIEGSYFNVMGFPIQRVFEELKKF
jgi:septum formation protein